MEFSKTVVYEKYDDGGFLPVGRIIRSGADFRGMV